MSDLIILTFPGGSSVRCANLADAKSRAARYGSSGEIVVEVTPHGGGLMATFHFDRQSGDWIPA